MNVEVQGRQVDLRVDNGIPSIVDGKNRQVISKEEATALLAASLTALRAQSIEQQSRATDGNKLESICRFYAERFATINNVSRMMEDGEDMPPDVEEPEIKIKFIEEPQVVTPSEGDLRNMVIAKPTKLVRTRITSVDAGPEYTMGA